MVPCPRSFGRSSLTTPARRTSPGWRCGPRSRDGKHREPAPHSQGRRPRGTPPRALPGLPGEREGDNPSQNQVHNEAIFADSYAGISYGRPFVASVSGLCPLCTSYIARGRSKIVRLSEPVPVYDTEPAGPPSTERTVRTLRLGVPAAALSTVGPRRRPWPATRGRVPLVEDVTARDLADSPRRVYALVKWIPRACRAGGCAAWSPEPRASPARGAARR
jgi:hypothetical protein